MSLNNYKERDLFVIHLKLCPNAPTTKASNACICPSFKLIHNNIFTHINELLYHFFYFFYLSFNGRKQNEYKELRNLKKEQAKRLQAL